MLIAADVVDSATRNRDVLTCSPFRNPMKHPSDSTQSAGEYLHSLPSSQVRHDETIGLGATIPPELSEFILFYVGDDYRDSSPLVVHPLGRSSSYRRHKDIAACSLVCRHWANQCREYMFSGMTLLISSPVKAETFVKYATRGCPSLTPVHELISGIVVEQRYDAPRSFCHRLHPVKAICKELYELRLVGPIPPKFSPRALDTPHWSLPPSMATPRSLLPYEKIRLSNVHLPSFSRVTKYVEHFGVAQEVYLDGVTWKVDDREPTTTSARRLRFPEIRMARFRFWRVHVPGRVRDTSRVERQDGTFGSVYSGTACTDNLDVCLQIATTHPSSLVHILHDDEKQWIVTLLSWFHTSFVLAGGASSGLSCT